MRLLNSKVLGCLNVSMIHLFHDIVVVVVVAAVVVVIIIHYYFF